MVNYQNSKIYKIVSDSSGLNYVGSTTEKYLSTRLSGHNSDYKRYIKTNKKYVSSLKVMEHPDRRIELIETYPCDR